VFAAFAVTGLVEDRVGWPVKRLVRAACRYRTVQLRAGQHARTAEGPVPPGLREALALVKGPAGARPGC